MAEENSSGCRKAAIIVIVVLLVGGLAASFLVYLSFRKGRELVVEQMELRRAEEAKVEAEAAKRRPVELREGKLPDYATYRPGEPVTREMFVAWRVDSHATSLLQETFREKMEGVEVTWDLMAGDIRRDGDQITGTFFLPYVIRSEDGVLMQNGVESIRCEFSPAGRDALLTIRRDQPATLRGRLSMKDGETALLDARQAGFDVE